MSRTPVNKTCPCGSNKAYTDCCGRYIDDAHVAPTPEALMRSRYTAYALGKDVYLVDSWHTDTRPSTVDTGGPVKWISLEIISAPDVEGDTGFVEFIARFKDNGRAGRLHERSRFRRESNRWYYVDGDVE